MNAIEATKQMKQALEASDNKFSFLMNSYEVMENLSIESVWMEVDYYSRKKGDYAHTHEEGPFQPSAEQTGDLIPLRSKYVTIEANEELLTISKIEVLDEELEPFTTLLVDGRRTTYDYYEGQRYDEMDVQHFLDIPYQSAMDLSALLLYELKMFDVFFEEKDKELRSLYGQKGGKK